MNTHSLSEPLRLHVELIDVGERLRAVDPDWVAGIAASMGERGQDTPIRVGRADPETGRYPLRAGAHRLEAAKALGWPTIEARISDAEGPAAELEEIDENLMRRELSALDRAVFLAKRKALWEELHPETKHGGKREKGKSKDFSTWAERFSKATAEKLGFSERSVQLAVRRANLPPAIRARIATHPIADSGAELDKLLAQTPAMQELVVDALLRAEKPARTVSAALAEIAGPAPESRAAETQRHLQALLGAWRKAGSAARRQFLDFLEKEGEAVRPAKAAPAGYGGSLTSFQRDALARIVAAHDAAGGGVAWVKKPANLQAATVQSLAGNNLIELGDAEGKAMRPTAAGRAALAGAEGGREAA